MSIECSVLNEHILITLYCPYYLRLWSTSVSFLEMKHELTWIIAKKECESQHTIESVVLWYFLLFGIIHHRLYT